MMVHGGIFLRSQAPDMMAIAQAVVPNLKRVALVRSEGVQANYSDFKKDILAATDSVEIIDFAGSFSSFPTIRYGAAYAEVASDAAAERVSNPNPSRIW